MNHTQLINTMSNQVDTYWDSVDQLEQSIRSLLCKKYRYIEPNEGLTYTMQVIAVRGLSEITVSFYDESESYQEEMNAEELLEYLKHAEEESGV